MEDKIAVLVAKFSNGDRRFDMDADPIQPRQLEDLCPEATCPMVNMMVTMMIILLYPLITPIDPAPKEAKYTYNFPIYSYLSIRNC